MHLVSVLKAYFCNVDYSNRDYRKGNLCVNNIQTNASKEQKYGIEQISDAINSLDKQTQINANSATQTHEIALETSNLASDVVNATNSKIFRGK